MNIEEVFQLMQQGFCLWAGAGVSRHLAGETTTLPPLWPELVATLEKDAEIDCDFPGLDLPQRLDPVLRKLGRDRFQRAIRKHVHDAMASAMIELGKRHADDAVPIPETVRQLATLGHLSNPIVNFNVEHFSSTILAAGAASEVKAFRPSVAGASTLGGRGPSTTSRPPTHSRAIYHPHGAIGVSGICVLAASEYRSMKDTLALRLAAHASFRSNLVIVGMSLDDGYLRQQLTDFREQIDRIVWIANKKPSPEIDSWRHATSVELVVISNWNDFWRGVVKQLPPPDEGKIAFQWFSTLMTNRAPGLQENSTIALMKMNGSTKGELDRMTAHLRSQGVDVPDVEGFPDGPVEPWLLKVGQYAGKTATFVER